MNRLESKNTILRYLTLICIIWFAACNEDIAEVPIPEQSEEESSGESEVEDFPVKEGLQVFNPALVDKNLILVNDAASNKVYLLNKKAEVVYEWEMGDYRLGNDAELLPDGRLLAMLESENPKILIGGFGGLLALIEPNGQLSWSYEYSDDNKIAHHDLLMLPNGNILFMTWERKSKEQGDAIGYALGTEIIYDAIKEIDPETNEIVWEWHMWDHLVQNHDENALFYGDLSNPKKIDINYVRNPDIVGDVSHCNGIDYDPEKDLIYLSANFYSEIWVIDHSTSTSEAATNSGGTYGVGGDLVYRFGNPITYGNLTDPVLFDRNHHPLLLDDNEVGDILVFSNGWSQNQSTAYELSLPLDYTPNDFPWPSPEVEWSFSDPDLFFGKVSGVVPLPNGNRLITEGDYGFWEVSPSGQLIWKYSREGFLWRGYSISPVMLDILNK